MVQLHKMTLLDALSSMVVVIKETKENVLKGFDLAFISILRWTKNQRISTVPACVSLLNLKSSLDQ